MQTRRTIGHAPRVAAMADEVAHLDGPCIGCAQCRGLCHALIDVLLLPDVIIARPDKPK
jgi:hypothetical protein